MLSTLQTLREIDIITIAKEMNLSMFCYIFIFIFGICFGSFLNVLIFRIPKKEEFVKTSSHCMSCGHKLAWYDNIPLLSWISLLGKCRYCKAKISAQYPIIEALNGFLWLLIIIVKGLTVNSVILCFMTSGLLALSMIDFKTFEIPNGFHFYFIALAMINIIFYYDNWLSFIIGIFCVSIPLLAIYLISGGTAIGGGDVKLMASCGLLLGWQPTVLALALGCILGSIIHIIRMKVFKAGRVLAMGPYLSMGLFIASLYGLEFINWYVSLINIQ